MLAEAFTLVLQLPPLAFSAEAPPRAYQPPRELTCPVGELGRPWSPPAPRPLWTARLAVDPRSLRPGRPDHLLNPLADALLLLALAGWASSTGGTVDFRPPAGWSPVLAAPLAPPYVPPGTWPKAGL
jgi:hypothetical protein